MTKVAAYRFDGSETNAPLAIAEAASKNLSLAQAENSGLASVSSRAMVIGTSEGPTGDKYRRFAILADYVSEAVTPHSACKTGCSHCCHIAVVISEFEAKQIGKAIGMVPERVTQDNAAAIPVERYKGVPCTFLAAGRCTIYQHRPIACKVHFNLADSNEMCDLAVPSEESTVPNINLTGFWLANVIAFGAHQQADIRDFFRVDD